MIFFSLPIVGECFSMVDAKYPNLDPIRRRNEALRRIFSAMVEDVITYFAISLIQKAAPSIFSRGCRELGSQLIQFSPDMTEKINEIRTYLFDNMYRSDRVNIMRERASLVVNGLFDFFMNDSKLLPIQWSHGENEIGTSAIDFRLFVRNDRWVCRAEIYQTHLWNIIEPCVKSQKYNYWIN